MTAPFGDLPLLYHGSRESALPGILASGIQPRSESSLGNWERSPSHDGRVYLTDIYALYFSSIAIEMSDVDDERLLVLEIDVRALDESRFFPDEDFIAQISYEDYRSKGGDLSLHQYAATRDITPYQARWRDSLARLGTLAYAGHIPPEAITRYALVDPGRAHLACFHALQPTITLANYRICAREYRDLMTYVMDGVVPVAVGDSSAADLVAQQEWTPEIVAFYGERAAFIAGQERLREQMAREHQEGVEVVTLRPSVVKSS